MFYKVSKFFLITAVLSIAIVSVSTLFPFIVGKYAWFRTSVDLALIFFLLGLLFNEQESIRLGINQRLKTIWKNPLVIAVTAFIAAFLLACLFGFNPARSFWSNFERGEGGFQLLHLWLFFMLLIILFKEEKDWRKIFGWSVVTGLLMVAYGLGAGFKISGFIGPAFTDPGYRLQGSIGNPAYVAAYTIFIFFYVVFLFVGQKKKGRFALSDWLLVFLGLVFLAAFYFAATRGAFLGFVAAIIGLLAYFVYTHKAWRKWLFSIIALVVILVAFLIVFQKTHFVQSIPGSRNFDISVAAANFQTRTIMWQIAWSGWLARPIFGWGPENFIYVFDTHFNIRYFDPTQGFGAWFDRAHSIYFDYLVETGALGLLAFLSIFVVFYWLLFKRTRQNKQLDNPREPASNGHQPKIGGNQLSNSGRQSFVNALLFSLPIAYLVQGVVLFDVLPIYLNVFLFLAFAVYKLKPLQAA